ncbi:MAG: response regulator [Vicinamibacterales bacterium]|nr:response regulator [Vicinamibacterales bacterium]
MNILICNSDAASSRIVRRMSSQRFHFGVVEASNGLEVLKILQDQAIDGLVLEAQMPIMGGLDALRVIRDSPQFARLPVVVLAPEADEGLVKQFMELGSLDFVIQHVSPDNLAARIENALRRLAAVGDTAESTLIRRIGLTLGPESTVVLADGDAEFRQYVKKVIARRFKVIEVDSGVQTLEACHQSLPDAVMLGTQLGLLGADRIARRLRAEQGKIIYTIAIPPRSEMAAARDSGLFDEVIARTYTPASLEKELSRLLQPSNPLEMLTQAVPDVRTRVIRAAEQVFGIMLMTDVEPVEAPAERTGPMASAAISIAAAAFVATVRIQFDLPSGREIAGAFLETDGEGLAEDDVVSVAGEVSNVLVGRLKAAFEERGIDSTIGLPVLSIDPAQPEPGQAPGPAGVDLHFRAIDRPVSFHINVSATENTQARESAAANDGTGVVALRSEAAA